MFEVSLNASQVGKFGGKGKGGLGQQHQASNNSSVSGLDQLNMSDKDINVSGAMRNCFVWPLSSLQAELEKMLLTLKLLQANWKLYLLIGGRVV